MPERLQAHGISWKVYNSPARWHLRQRTPVFQGLWSRVGPGCAGIEPDVPGRLHGRLSARKAAAGLVAVTGARGQRAPRFLSGCVGRDRHAPDRRSVDRPSETWAKTALFITWDENGGFFDHVAPPTPPKGTKGEYLTVSPASCRRSRRARADRSRVQGPDAGRVAVLPRRAGLPGRVRSHVDAAVLGDPVRGGGPQSERMATRGDRGSDQRLQLRGSPPRARPALPSPAAPAACPSPILRLKRPLDRCLARSAASASDRAGSSSTAKRLANATSGATVTSWS